MSDATNPDGDADADDAPDDGGRYDLEPDDQLLGYFKKSRDADGYEVRED
jgi:hypothetical protein